MSKHYRIALQLSPLTESTGLGGHIVLELSDDDAAIRMAHKIAQATGRQVAVRDHKKRIIQMVAAPPVQ